MNNIPFKQIILEEISFRSAEENDANLIYHYINNEEIRNQSFSSSRIPWEEHQKWFSAKLRSNKSLIIIATTIDTNIFLAQIKFDRLDTDQKGILVGIFVNPVLKGKGIGSKVLRLISPIALRHFYAQYILAKIKKNNLASIKAFTKAGYKFHRETKIQGIEVVELLYELN